MTWLKTGTFTLLALLAGCKTHISTEIKQSDLNASANKLIAGQLMIEVAGCNDYQDSRKPSSSVLDVQKMIPAIFSDATYVECFRQKMDSYARFSLPVALDVDRDDTIFSNDHINFRRDEHALLKVVIPKKVKERLDANTKRNLGSTNLDLNFHIQLLNDTEQPLDFNAYAVFINGSPQIINTLQLPKNERIQITLSNVSVQTAIQHSQALVLTKP
ncbi:DUF7424 family protein [Alcaligenes sp. SDU_A2]|uniref:DUF7424 family protein n=1 Tax=Alcaligenes sp. SDU_A2 TaxID=3136634 RepID=UPI00312010DE